MLEAIYETWQAVLMMGFICGSIWMLVWIDVRRQMRKRRHHHTHWGHDVLDREPHSKNYSRIHRDWRRL